MLLAIDIGSTNITLGVFADGALLHTFRLQSRREQTSDEYALALAGLLELVALPRAAVEDAIVVSVVPRLTPVLVESARRAFHCTALVVGPALDTGVALAIERPSEVGMDRVVNAAAVRHHALERAGATGAAPGFDVGAGAIVIDLGTATTFDCLSPTGEFLGGVIAPGMRVSFEALIGRTAKLPDVELSAPPSAVGKNTLDCLRSGIVFGYAGLVDGLVARLRSELPFACPVLATGGLAGAVAPHARSIEAVDIELTLRGLELIHRRQHRRA